MRTEKMLSPDLLDALRMVQVALSGRVPEGQCFVALSNGISSEKTKKKEKTN